MIEVFMPKAGMDMTEGTLIRWLKNVGDKVEKDEPIMEIETDKITMESEAPGDGVLLAKVVEDGSVVPVLSVLGYIGEPGEKVPEGSAAAPVPAAAPAPAPAAAPAPTPAAAPSPAPAAPAAAAPAGGPVLATPYAKTLAKEAGVDIASIPPGPKGIIKAADVLATPVARRIADANGIDIAAVPGTGFGGKVTRDDALRYAENHSQGEVTPDGLTVAKKTPLKGMRKTVAKRMLESHTQIPNVTQCMKVNMGPILAFRKQLNEGRTEKISLNDMFIKATALAVRNVPIARTMYTDTDLVTYEEANIGFAVALPGGLIVPVVRNADKLSLSEISKKAKELATLARNGSLAPSDCEGGTFTISNMGMYDITTFTPIINLPQSGIMGFTAIDSVLRKVDGQIVECQESQICYTYDHRVIDGAEAAKFKMELKKFIENPTSLI